MRSHMRSHMPTNQSNQIGDKRDVLVVVGKTGEDSTERATTNPPGDKATAVLVALLEPARAGHQIAHASPPYLPAFPSFKSIQSDLIRLANARRAFCARASLSWASASRHAVGENNAAVEGRGARGGGPESEAREVCRRVDFLPLFCLFFFLHFSGHHSGPTYFSVRDCRTK
jgi:hypothetical protein